MPHLRACVLRAGTSLAFTAICACGSGETWDQSNIDTMIQHEGFTHVNAKPYASSLGPPPPIIDVWIDPLGAADYAKIDPGRTGSGAHVPRGTQIVRAVLDADGNVAKLTMMCKGEPGYDPSFGDWWFAETDAKGTPINGDDGAPLIGALESCHSCHLDRMSDDFLFGVPAADR
jgi:hypothetical protein